VRSDFVATLMITRILTWPLVTGTTQS